MREKMIVSGFMYLLMFLITSLLTELTTRIKKISLPDRILKILLVMFIIFIPSFVAGIRYNVGTDFFSYTRIYENIINIGNIGRIESGYVVLNQLADLIGGDVQLVFFMSQAISILFVYLFLSTYKKQFSSGMGMFIYLLLFYNSSLNIVRQGIAIPIILYSYKYMDEKKPLKFTLLVILASSFHISAIVALPFYYLYNNIADRGRVFMIFIYLLAFVSLLNYQEIIRIVSVYVLEDPYYLSYAQSEEIDLGIGIIVSYLPTIFLGSIFYNRFKYASKSYEFYFFLGVIGFVVKLLPYFGANFLNRLADYFIVSSVWLIPLYIRVLAKKRDTYILVLLFIAFCIFIWFHTYILSNSAETVPYITIFD